MVLAHTRRPSATYQPPSLTQDGRRGADQAAKGTRPRPFLVVLFFGFRPVNRDLDFRLIDPDRGRCAAWCSSTLIFDMKRNLPWVYAQVGTSTVGTIGRCLSGRIGRGERGGGCSFSWIASLAGYTLMIIDSLPQHHSRKTALVSGVR